MYIVDTVSQVKSFCVNKSIKFGKINFLRFNNIMILSSMVRHQPYDCVSCITGKHDFRI